MKPPERDLALAVDAKLIVSRDKDLLSLRDAATDEARDFSRRYPGLLIFTPVRLKSTIAPKVRARAHLFAK